MKIFARMLLVDAFGVLAHVASHVGASQVRRQIAARVSPADLEAGEAVECAIENQMHQEQTRLERISYNVAEIACPRERIRLGHVLRVVRMHKYDHSELLHLG